MKRFALALAMFLLPTLAIAHGPTSSVSNKNSSSISYASLTDLVTLDIGYHTAGDWVYVEGFVLFQKGATGGDTLTLIRSSATGGTQHVLFGADTLDLEQRWWTPPLSGTQGQSQMWLSGWGRVMVTGNITLTLKGASAGSASTIGGSQAQIRAYFFD